ncbi:MAG TPA: hypothetical protein PLU88_02775 [Armatimonadota bacterium]|nr:hypothetical protein [Armatimonadota bacterium]HPP74037.1 hypothetical protein [Armatimonadota bacterium]
MEKVNYGGWPNCIRLSNDQIELIATTDVGPRIIRFGFIGQDNEFYENKELLGKTGGDEYKSYGGHRFWLAPEVNPRTYEADNSPVEYRMEGDTLVLITKTDPRTGMQKQVEVTLDSDKNHVEVIHTVTNHNLWDIEMAPWALSVMTSGGKLVIPQEPYAPHPSLPDYPGQVTDQRFYLPVRNLVLWSYTKLNDPRYVFTSKYIILKQDPSKDRPQKIGVSNEQRWAAYARNGHLVVKTFDYDPEELYPDNGCNFETFTNQSMLESETLGPLVILEPGASVSHREDWYLFDGVHFEDTDESIDENVLPKVKSVLG